MDYNNKWIDDPEAAVFWFNIWLGITFPGDDKNTPIFNQMFDKWVQKELGHM